MKGRARLAATAAIAAAIAAEGGALAADRTSVLDAPAPPTLPALAHPLTTFTFEYTAASIDPATTKTSSAWVGRAYAWFAHAELEVPIVPRAWYFGIAHDFASGAVPRVGQNFFFGNPEFWARGLWSSLVGISSGGGLGLVLPLPRPLDDKERAVLRTVRVVRPWDAAYFTDLTLTLRPWIDVRHIAGRFILQLRQGLDVAILLRERQKGERRFDYAARTAFYVGFRAARPLGLGLEVWEVYAITGNVDDGKRAAFAISPSVRLLLGRVSPALSVLLPITTPLRGEAASYYAARLNVGFDFDSAKIRARAPSPEPHAPPDPEAR